MGLINDLRTFPANAATGTSIEHARSLIGMAGDAIVEAVLERDRARGEVATLRAELSRSSEALQRARGGEYGVPAARKDLVSRLMAVAIAVGLASQVVSLHIADRWAQALPGDDLVGQIARITISMLVILLGWDWYNRDVQDKPLTRVGRFLLDAGIVLADLGVLLSCGHAGLWSGMMLTVFALYVVWDIMAIVDHPAAFGLPSKRASWWYASVDVTETYFEAVRGDPSKRGPMINLVWFFYFFMVLVALPPAGAQAGFATCLLVGLGACLLWCEGMRKADGSPLVSPSLRLKAFGGLAALYTVLLVFLTV